MSFLFLASAALLSHVGGLRNDFAYDDHVQLVENVALRNLRNIPQFFIDPAHTSSSGVVEEIYRPLRATLFALEYRLWGLNPAGFHAVNIVFHIFNSFLLYLFLKRFVASEMPACGAALLFAVHPALTENVSWVCGRSDLMCFSFFLVGLLCYLRSEQLSGAGARATLYGLSLLSLALALLSKEMAVTLPAAILAIDLWRDGFKGFRTRWLKYVPFIALTLGYLIIRVNIMSRFAQTAPLGETPLHTAGIMARGALYYIKLVLLPLELNVVPHIDAGVPLGDARTIGAMVLVGLLIVSAFAFRRPYPTASLGVLLFFVLLTPVSNIVPIKAIVAERFIYIPSLGYFIVCAAWLQTANSFRDSRGLRALTSAAVSVGIFVFSTITIARTMDWKDNQSLFMSAVKSTPNNPRAHTLLAKEFFMSGNYENSRRECLIALRLNPGLAEAHVVLGNIYLKQGLVKPAEEEFKLALSLDPDNSEISNGLGIVYRQQGRHEEALSAFKAALEKNPMVSGILNNVGSVLLEQGELKDAEAYFARALEVRPDNWEAACNMAYALIELGRPAEAIDLIGQWFSRHPEDVEMLNLLGQAYSRRGDYEQAIDAYGRAILANPTDIRAYNYLASLRMARGEYEEAIRLYRGVLRLYPASVNQRLLLATALEKSGRHEEAMEELRAAARLSPDAAVTRKTLEDPTENSGADVQSE
ncbi:MAG: hypothetical protein Kow0099_32630 [Candidatus Abyssubacteria bacterium]